MAGLVAKKYGTEHYLIGAIPSYFVSREARKYVKAVGYRRYVPLAD
ncbi:hypothetical protein [Lebetimonas sp. JH292]|nr:hypothetical protein [Lebetimonas sp. JH292]